MPVGPEAPSLLRVDHGQSGEEEEEHGGLVTLLPPRLQGTFCEHFCRC